MESLFTDKQLNSLRKEYSKIQKIDLASDYYKKLIDLLDSLDQNALKQLVRADILFISKLARNRVKK